LAAKWAAQNSHLLPVDPRPIAPPLRSAVRAPVTTEQIAAQAHPGIATSTVQADPWSEKIVIVSEA
jgi:hypothetical protein